ncbi:hypothetical protein OF83DRAFT_917332 [Amylostereum chailletii]|nr:hypothetical protein OF83DRAFT_917332 [Amylostereum chailletii]
MPPSDVQDDEDAPVYMSTSTEDEVLIGDRQLAPRGTTPLLDTSAREVPLEWTEHLDAETGDWHSDRSEEYLALLGRGATKLMCEMFCLEFEQATGIVAWADEALLAEFAGPAMRAGDRWKIYLCRRIELDEGDLDGRMFIEELLEQTVIFPCADKNQYGFWTTTKKNYTWMTKPLSVDDAVECQSGEEEEGDVDGEEGDMADEEEADEDAEEVEEEDEDAEGDEDEEEEEDEFTVKKPDGPIIFANEYESSDTEEEETSLDSPLHLRDTACLLPSVTDALFEDEPYDPYAEEDDSMGQESDTSTSHSSADTDFDSDEVLSGDEEM